MFPRKLSEVIINVTTKFLAGELEGDFVRSDRDNFSVWRFVKITYQRCDVNLIRIDLLLEMLEHNINLSGPIILLKRMTSRI